MLRKIRQFFTHEAALLPEPAPPKLPSAEQAVPNYLGKSRGAVVQDRSSNITNSVLSVFTRNEATMNETIKKLVLSSPDLFTAVLRKITTAVTTKYTVIATDETGRVNEKATELVQAFTRRLDFAAPDYSKFTRATDFRALSASLLHDNLRYGAMCFELVLGKGRIPSHFKAIPVRLLKWADDMSSTYPIYKGAEKDIPLNFPTIFYSAGMQDNETPYAESPLQAAIQACLWDFEFTDALRKAAIKNLLGRLVVTINSENFRKTIPLTVQADAEKMKEYMDTTVANLESQLNGLQPEDALVIFDSLEVDTIQDKNRSEDRSIVVLKDLINGRITAGASILPSVIGRGEGSQAASMEAQLFVNSSTKLQHELNILYSRALTLAARVFGQAVTVQFTYAEANLRPELELASFKAVEQSSVLELLSVGMITDIEASIRLTGTLPPKGYKPLAGTMFKNASPNAGGTNNYSNTSVDDTSGKPDSTSSQKAGGDTKSPGVKSK